MGHLFHDSLVSMTKQNEGRKKMGTGKGVGWESATEQKRAKSKEIGVKDAVYLPQLNCSCLVSGDVPAVRIK